MPVETASKDGDRPHVRFSMLHLDINENGLPTVEEKRRSLASRKYLLVGIVSVLVAVILAIIALAVGLAVSGEIRKAINGSSSKETTTASVTSIIISTDSGISSSSTDVTRTTSSLNSSTSKLITSSHISTSVSATSPTSSNHGLSTSAPLPTSTSLPTTSSLSTTTSTSLPTTSSLLTTTSTSSWQTSSPLPACNPGEFQCSSGQCVSETSSCNRRIDCLDQSDESFCQACEKSGGFQCESGLCLWDRRRRCDGVVDCTDISDEVGCPLRSNYYLCKNGIQIRQTLVCNGVDDCDDNTDEQHCDCVRGRLQCPDGECILREWKCDGYPDCVNGTDEVGCDRCSEGEFVCRDYTCMDRSKVCDGVFDCRDGGDEQQCVHLTNGSSTSQLIISLGHQDLQVCADNWTDSHSIFICQNLDRSFQKTVLTDMPNSSPSLQYLILQSNTVFSGEQPIISYFLNRSSCPSSKTVALSCAPQACGVRKAEYVTPFVAGGSLAPEGKWPWVVSLSYLGEARCAGALISPQWIITAGHCIVRPGQYNYTMTPWYIEVLAGSVDRLSNATKVRAVQVYPHPHLVDTPAGALDWDVALVKLAAPLPMTDYIQPICMPHQGQDFFQTPLCYVAGWGLVNNVQYLTPRKLRDAKMKIWDSRRCQRNTVGGETLVNTNSTICAGYLMGLPTGCKGDSGGPLMCQDSPQGRWTLAGVMSSGSSQCPDSFSMRANRFARISQLQEWIKTVISDG